MLAGKKGGARKRALQIIRDSGSRGIGQKDLEKALGISKSYCSEVVAGLNSDGLIVKAGRKGIGSTIYILEFYPGKLEGIFRAGLLKSSEYIPSMAFLMDSAASIGSRVVFRFYDSTMELIGDLKAGSLEFALAPTNALILSALLSSDLKIHSGLSSGGSGIIYSKEWRKDALLSTEVSTMISMSIHAPDSETPEEIETFSDPEKGLAKFVDEKYRAIAIWEPYLSAFRKDFSPEKVVKYESIMDRFPCCSLVTTRPFWLRNGESFGQRMQDFLDGTVTGFENGGSIDKAVEIVSEALKMKPELIRESMGSYDFLSRKISRKMLASLGISLSMRQEKQIFASGLIIYDR